MHSFCISVESEVVLSDEILEDFLIRCDFPARIQEIEIGDRWIDGQHR